MKKLVILSLILLAGIAEAQSVNTCVNSAGNSRAPLCDASNNLQVAVAAVSPATAATFQALGSIAFGTMDGTYRDCIDPASGSKVVIIDNQSNGDVLISMDAGTTTNFHVKAGDVLSIDLAAQGLVTDAKVQAKDGTTASTAGTLYCYAWK